MVVTISTHNGSTVAREHNIRNPKVVTKEPHINADGRHEVWHDEPVRQAYDRLFGSAVAAYNARQSRPERRITSYYKEVCNDAKKHPVYEMIIGVYGKTEDGSPICSAEQGKEIMQQFVENWKQRNPNLELIGAYYHADEPGAEPHLHLDYIPVAHGYTRGLETQTGLVKALGEQGFEKKGKATAQIQWEKRENDYLTSLCEAVGLRVDHPRQEGRQHLATQELKLQSRVDELERATEQEAARFLEADAKATDAEMRAASAEKTAANAEQRTAAAEKKLKEVNAQVEVATKEVKAALDKAAKASEITSLTSMLHRVGQHKNTVTYNENMLDRTRAIGHEAYEDLQKANQTKQEAVAIQQRAEAKEKAIDPLYQQASEAHRQAQAELSRAKKISEQSEQLIEQKAEARASEMVREIMQGTPTRERDRMRKYMDSLQFKDGTTALEQFEEQERQLQRKLNRGLQR